MATLEERQEFVETGVLVVVKEALDEDAVFGLVLEVLSDIVDDDDAPEVSSEVLEILR